MRFLTWTVRLLAFLALLAFAVKNTELVTLRFYFDLAWQAPLVVVLLVFFSAGAALGLVAALATLFRQRRAIRQLEGELREARSLLGRSNSGAGGEPAAVPPAMDA